MKLFSEASKVEGGSFAVVLVFLFIVFALGTFAFLQNTGLLAEHKVDLFSVIGIEDEEELAISPEDEISIGVTEENEIEDPEDVEIPVIDEEEEKEDPEPEPEEVTEPEEDPEEEPEVSPEPAEKYTKTAGQGEGLTHLARKAIARYLQDHHDAPEMTPEHKVYAEDYIQRQMGSKTLNVGETVSFSESLIGEAVEKSQNLTQAQLENLKQYSALISW